MIEGRAQPETNAPNPMTSEDAINAFFRLLGNHQAVERARKWARGEPAGRRRRISDNQLSYEAGMHLMREALAMVAGGLTILDKLDREQPTDAPAG